MPVQLRKQQILTKAEFVESVLLLVAGCWLLVAGCWLLVADFSIRRCLLHLKIALSIVLNDTYYVFSVTIHAGCRRLFLLIFFKYRLGWSSA